MWQLEKGTTLHIQGFCILKGSHDLNWVKKRLLPKAHWEPMNGTVEENIKYCSKDETRVKGYKPWTFGDKPKSEQGRRNDLEMIHTELDNHGTVEQVSHDHFGSWCRYHKSFNTYAQAIVPKRNFKTQVIVLIGPPGIGKSYWANKNTFNAFHVWSKDWWDGYDGKSDIIWNDFTGELPYNQFLALCDADPWTLPTKGGSVNAAPRRLVLTSNVDTDQWYDFSVIKGTVEALDRRIDYLYCPLTAVANVVFFNEQWTHDNVIENPYPWADEVIEISDDEYTFDEEEQDSFGWSDNESNNNVAKRGSKRERDEEF